MRVLLITCILLALVVGVSGFALPGSEPNNYGVSERISLRVDALTSTAHPSEPLDYYSLAYCQPVGGVEDIETSLFEGLFGTSVKNSAVGGVQVLVDVPTVSLCNRTMHDTDELALRSAAKEGYQVNWLLDGLQNLEPVVWHSEQDGGAGDKTEFRLGFPTARLRDNHLEVPTVVDVTIGYNHHDNVYNVVQFFTKPTFERVSRGQVVNWRYSVTWEETDLEWEDRYDVYMQLDSRVLSGHIAVIVVLLLVIVVGGNAVLYAIKRHANGLPIISRSVVSDVDTELKEPVVAKFVIEDEAETSARRGSASLSLTNRGGGDDEGGVEGSGLLTGQSNDDYVRLDESTARASDVVAVSGKRHLLALGWTQVKGDLFRKPRAATLLAVLTGQGVHMLFVLVIFFFAGVVGSLYISGRPHMTSITLISFLVGQLLLGWSTGRTYKKMGGTRPRRTCALSVLSVTGLVAFVILGVNALMTPESVTTSVPVLSALVIVALWLVSAVVLVVPTFYLAYAMAFVPPVQPSPVARAIEGGARPRRRRLTRVVVWLAIGLVQFSSTALVFYFIFQSIWGPKLYYLFGLGAVSLLLFWWVVACTAIATSYALIQASKDWRWWWTSWLTGVASAPWMLVAIFLYYAIFTEIRGWQSSVLFFSYSGMIVLVLTLLNGSIALLATMRFLTHTVMWNKSQ